MSKYMQIDIRLLPFYERDFRSDFPKLAKALGNAGYLDSSDPDPSIYDLVDVLRRIDLDPQVPSPLKDIVRPFLEKLTALKDAAREALLARKLNDLDQLLYRMEDEVEDLEKAL